MGVQMNDNIQIGDMYTGNGMDCMVVAISDSHICLCGPLKTEIHEMAVFRVCFTKKNPHKSWPNKPDSNKFYGANYCGGTTYAYCPVNDRFYSRDGRNICKSERDETTEMYFLGNGNLSKTTNNYQIIEFDNIKDLIIWLDW